MGDQWLGEDGGSQEFGEDGGSRGFGEDGGQGFGEYEGRVKGLEKMRGGLRVWRR